MRLSFVRTFVLFVLVSVIAPRAEAEGLRLEDAVRVALENNERARKARRRVDVAAGQLDRARAAFFPRLTAAAGGQYRPVEDRAGRHLTTSGSITLEQPILNPSAFPLYAQARHQLRADEWTSVEERRALAFDTARAFLLTLTSERVLEAAARRLDRARANLQNAEARAAAGLASTNDATRSSLELATAAREVATADGRVATAYLNLGFLMGRQARPPLSPPDRTTQAAASFESAPEDQVRAALDRRPDLRAARERTEALRASVRETHYRLAPTVSASAQVRILPDPLPTERGQEMLGTVNLSWSIFDAGFRYADRRTRTAQAEIAALDESLLERGIDNDIRVALVSLQASRESFKIADGAVLAAQRNTEETEILYRQGLARAIELTDATSKRFDAEVNRASAKLAMEQAYLELRYALGLDPIDAALAPGGGAR